MFSTLDKYCSLVMLNQFHAIGGVPTVQYTAYYYRLSISLPFFKIQNRGANCKMLLLISFYTFDI